ncbi:MULTISPECIES: flagellar basal body-associated protein FliL [Bacillales]|uniref:Flagellar protein FliL n=1 Tax=Lysinibacillus louembei TaxID=1470088 RepID=A0ABZ0RXF7_9BACI|nr:MULTISPECIES: flagellar basal body-associated protein FliL [Bacillales]MCT6923554.1 flagellar basal body-associated protein FliL [Metasolibacillus sp.]MCT6939723.1 flagellar basal body-associated protein FliL [Metasolibacillus sp.]WPK11947.1 flagellar basal body-associated protein FliL [Lysinibacillus louembei]
MKSNKLLMIMIIILVAIILVGAILFVVYMNANKDSVEKGPTIDEIVEASIDVPEIRTNLKDKHVVIMQMKLTTDSKEAAAELEKRLFQVNNIAIQELSDMELKDLEGSQGKEAFGNILKTKVNELMQDGEVTKVYLTAYISQ